VCEPQTLIPDVVLGRAEGENSSGLRSNQYRDDAAVYETTTAMDCLIAGH
jgi:hypothetical protein